MLAVSKMLKPVLSPRTSERVFEAAYKTPSKISMPLKCLSSDVAEFSSAGLKQPYCAIKTTGREKEYTQIGINVDIGQGCLHFGSPGEVLKSYGFDTCAPLAIRSSDGSKFALGHIDSQSTVDELVLGIRKNMTSSEIKDASFYYMRGAETLHPEAKLGNFAIETIEKVFNALGVKGQYCGKLNTGFEDVIATKNSIKVVDENNINKIFQA